jgi:hypothetical protein
MKEQIKYKLKIEASLAALTGLLSNPNIVKCLDEHNKFFEDIAIESTVYADCLIKQLESEEEDDNKR